MVASWYLTQNIFYKWIWTVESPRHFRRSSEFEINILKYRWCFMKIRKFRQTKSKMILMTLYETYHVTKYTRFGIKSLRKSTCILYPKLCGKGRITGKLFFFIFIFFSQKFQLCKSFWFCDWFSMISESGKRCLPSKSAHSFVTGQLFFGKGLEDQEIVYKVGEKEIREREIVLRK